MTDSFCPWSEKYLLRIEMLDEQHKNIIGLLEKLFQAVEEASPDAPRILGELIAAEKTHFAAEETLLKKHNYPGLEKQTRDHSALLAHFERLHSEISTGLVTLDAKKVTELRDMTASHFLGPDKAYGEFLRIEGAR